MSRGSTSIPRTPTSATSSILISSPSTGLTSEFFHVKQEDIEYQLLSPISGSSPMTTGKKCYTAQCGNFRIFFVLTFYVKSILANLEVLQLLFLPFLGLWILLIWWISAFKKCENSYRLIFLASKCVKMPDFAFLESPKLISRKIWIIKNHEISLLCAVLYNQTVLYTIHYSCRTCTHSGNFRNFLPLRFYVKSKLVNLESQIVPFNTFRDSEFWFLWIFELIEG